MNDLSPSPTTAGSVPTEAAIRTAVVGMPAPILGTERSTWVPDQPLLGWVVPIVISIVGVAVQITALRRTAKQQERSARLSAAATYAARIFDAAAAGGSPHDQSQAMAVQREILTQIAKDLRETGMTLSVPEEWPLKR